MKIFPFCSKLAVYTTRVRLTHAIGSLGAIPTQLSTSFKYAIDNYPSRPVCTLTFLRLNTMLFGVDE